MDDQYPQNCSLEMFIENRDSRLMPEDLTIGGSLVKMVAELDPCSNMEAVAVHGNIQSMSDEGGGIYEASINILYEDHSDDEYDYIRFEDGFWKEAPGRERIGIRIGSEVINALGGYLLTPDDDEVFSHTEERNESPEWEPCEDDGLHVSHHFTYSLYRGRTRPGQVVATPNRRRTRC